MDPGHLDLRVVQGATFRLKLTWRAPDPEDTSENPALVPVDLTGWSARAQVRVRGTLALTLDSNDAADGTIALSSDGRMELYASAEVVRKTLSGFGSWSLEVTNPSGEEDVLIVGPSEIVKEVTREP